MGGGSWGVGWGCRVGRVYLVLKRAAPRFDCNTWGARFDVLFFRVFDELCCVCFCCPPRCWLWF